MRKPMKESPSKKNLLNQLIKHFQPLREVEAIILLGSMAENKDDEYSDIDLLIITSMDNLKNLWIKTQKYLVDEFKVFKLNKNIYSESNTNVSVLLEDFSEIDIVFRTKENFQSKYNVPDFPYMIIYNSIPDLETNIIEDKNDLNLLLNRCTENIWQKFKTAAVEIKRGKFFKANYEINRIRDQLVEILTVGSNLCSVGFRGAEELDKNTKTMLKKTYSRAFTYKGIKRSLLYCFDLLLFILKKNNFQKEAIEYKQIISSFFKKIYL